MIGSVMIMLFFGIIGLIIFCISIYGILYVHCFKEPFFRVLEQTHMYMGEIRTTFTVQQLHKLGNLEWWTIADSGGEWDNGSVYDSMEEAQKYINSCLYKPTRKLHPKQP